MRIFMLALMFFVLSEIHVTAQTAALNEKYEQALALLVANEDAANPSDQQVVDGIAAMRQLADEGSANAANFLGVAYEEGAFGFDVDHKKAETFFRDAYAASEPDNVSVAALNLANLLEQELSFGDAGWAEVVTLLRSAYDDERLKSIVAAHLGIAIIQSPEGWEHRKEVSSLLLEGIASEPDNPLALWYLARGYENGWYGETDERQACEFYRMGAELGNSVAYWPTGMCYLGSGLAGPDEDEAFKWVLKGAQAGDEKAYISTAVMFATGQGVGVEKLEAAAWYEKAVELGGESQAHAMRGLAGMHLQGELGEDSNRLRGFALLELASEMGDDQAPLLLQIYSLDEAKSRGSVESEKVRLRLLYNIPK